MLLGVRSEGYQSHRKKCSQANNKCSFCLGKEEGRTTPLLHEVVWSRYLQKLPSFVCRVAELTQTSRVQLLDLDGIPKVSLTTLLSDLKVNNVALQMS